MKLIGMLDSPYVRRVAISLKLQGLEFEHQALSVFSTFDAFAAINPVVKAPTLITDDGTMLMDSGLILEHTERMVAAENTLAPASLADHARAQRMIGLALAACEKTVQIVYEHNLRPTEKQHKPWLDRVHGQLDAAYRLLNDDIGQPDLWLFSNRMMQADITIAVAFRFSCEMLSDRFTPADYPAIAALSERAEATEAFTAFPFR